jgi:hypothetical protein
MTKLRNGSGSGVGRSSSSSASRIISNLKLLTDVDVLHRLRQPLSSNACAQRHCSHICLPKLRYPGFICTCPNNDTRMTYTLHSDGRTCIVTHINVPDQSDGSDVFPSSLTNSNVQVPPDASVKRENGRRHRSHCWDCYWHTHWHSASLSRILLVGMSISTAKHQEPQVR